MSGELRAGIVRTSQDWLERPGATTSELADALLSGPLAPLLDVQAAVERVEAVKPGFSLEANARRLAWFTDAELADELARRHALDGPT